jgi:LysM repeat protein
MEEEERHPLKSWGPRLLAPLAFFVAATILILLVNNAIESDSTATPQSTGTTPSVSTSETGTGTVTTPSGKRRFYRIKVGDTLETVANKRDTSVEALIELNPNIDPNNLQPGQRIRVG